MPSFWGAHGNPLKDLVQRAAPTPFLGLEGTFAWSLHSPVQPNILCRVLGALPITAGRMMGGHPKMGERDPKIEGKTAKLRGKWGEEAAPGTWRPGSGLPTLGPAGTRAQPPGLGVCPRWRGRGRPPLPGHAARAGTVDLPGREEVHGHGAPQGPGTAREAQAAPLRRRRHSCRPGARPPGRRRLHRRPAPAGGITCGGGWGGAAGRGYISVRGGARGLGGAKV